MEEEMNTSIFVDPDIDLSSEGTVSVIVHFKTQPARVAMALAKEQGNLLSFEQATQKVENSHARFLKELEQGLVGKHVEYTITRTYKTVINGMAMKLPAKSIIRLLQSSEIAAIYANQEVQLDPPIQFY
ncbi:protease inhibitor I9 family protein [Rossellomorea sp. BNER]|uniref:protease inhibitor I9 family protein n=1 Tax=Rossellomorea sp. BNER TaxID=2962031 RepID=UPI003AF1EB6C